MESRTREEGFGRVMKSKVEKKRGAGRGAKGEEVRGGKKECKVYKTGDQKIE